MADSSLDVRSAWKLLNDMYHPSPEQLAQFHTYVSLLQEWNQRFNITARHDTADIIVDHFCDSLALSNYVDLSQAITIADVGTGGGFPAIPLKIMYPNLRFILIEVTAKKREFLAHVIDQLGLQGCELSERDWRSFVRETTYKVDYVIARASLQPSELIRMFKPSSPYKDGTLVYWASEQWVPDSSVEPLIIKDVSYVIGHKKRRLLFFRSAHG